MKGFVSNCAVQLLLASLMLRSVYDMLAFLAKSFMSLILFCFDSILKVFGKFALLKIGLPCLTGT